MLYVSPSFLRRIPDLSPQESHHILEMLWELLFSGVHHSVQVRQSGVAFWDNRSTAHLAPRDIFDIDFDRQFYRVTLNGDVPKGVDSKLSEGISGEVIKAV